MPEDYASYVRPFEVGLKLKPIPISALLPGELKAMQADKSGYRESDEPLTDRACVRCAHYRRGFLAGAVDAKHLCQRPQLGSALDRVAGADIPNSRDAYRERADNVALGLGEAEDRCGPDGKFWSQSGF